MPMRTSLFILLLTLAAACQSPAPESRYDQVAAAYCSCTRHLVTLNRQAQTMLADTTAQIDFHALQTEHEKAKECAAALISRYGKLKPDEIPQVEKSLTLKCPALAQEHDLLRELLGE